MSAIAVALLALSGVQIPKSHVTNPGVNAELKEAYAGYATAILKHDIDAVMGFLAPDILWKYPDGKSDDAKKIRPAMKSWIITLKPESKLWFTLKKIVPKKDSVEVWAVMNFDGWVMRGAKASPAKFTSAWHDTWVRTKSGLRNKVGENLLVMPY